jgi:hypothetical protein
MIKTKPIPSGFIPIDLMEVDMLNLSFVNWDRYDVNEEQGLIGVYGWIPRQDLHEDFVFLQYYHKGEGLFSLSFATSSEKYTKKIFKILKGVGEHNDCERVEKRFNIPNMIKLKTSVQND